MLDGSKTCSVEGCGAPVRRRGWCMQHYKRIWYLTKAYGGVSQPCECGCGVLTENAFVNGHNTRTLPHTEQARRGRHNDGSKQRDRGSGKSYRKVGGRHEHRRVAEKMLGRKLRPGEIVHHKNHNKRDNREENLQVMTQADHARLHLLERRASAK